jgi:hypothetical protein
MEQVDQPPELDQYHLDIQTAVKVVFSDWTKAYRNFVTSLKNGRHLRNYIHTRTPTIFEKASLQNGMYVYHDALLHVCISKHIERWKEVSQVASNMTRTFLSEMAKRCLSMTEIVIIIFLLKTRYFLGKLTSVFYDAAKTLSVPHYNTDIKWPMVFTRVSEYAQGRQKVTCPEMDVVFQRCITSVFNLIINKAVSFESNIKILEALYENDWKDVQLDDDIIENLCFGGLSPIIIAKCGGRMNYRLLRNLECYRNFENGNFLDITSLLLTVQISTRVNLIIQSRPDQRFVTKKELELRFSDIKLNKITRVLNRDPLYELFMYPKSFAGSHPPHFECIVCIGDIIYTTVLELAVVYWLFGETKHSVICDALYVFMVTSKINSFMQSSTETVQYKGTEYPKRWTKYKVFKELNDEEYN